MKFVIGNYIFGNLVLVSNNLQKFSVLLMLIFRLGSASCGPAGG